MSDTQGPGAMFELFTEIGIIAQLSRTMLEARLPDGLIAPHFNVLNHLARLGDGRTPLQIANSFQVPKTSMTHTLKGLADRGLVDILPNPEDGRSKCVNLTEKGRVLRGAIIARLGQDFALLAKGFGPDRFSQMTPDLRALRIFLDENRELLS